MNPIITSEMILNSSNIEEFSDLTKKFKCSLCPLREEAWVRDDHVYPIPNDYQEHLHKQQVDLVLIGDTLGPDEGKIGVPFVSPSGEFMRGALASVMSDLDATVSYMFMNICMCHPENNRAPYVSEARACNPFLLKQLSLVNPNAILLLGSTATRHMLKLSKNPVMKEYKGKRFDVTLPNRFESIPVLTTYHPSYVYRQLVDGSLPRELEEHYVSVIKEAIKFARRYKSER